VAIANREDGVSITQDDVQLDFAPVSALDARGNHVTIQVRPREQQIVIEAGDSDTVFPVAIELVLSQSLPSMARGAGLGLSVVMARDAKTALVRTLQPRLGFHAADFLREFDDNPVA